MCIESKQKVNILARLAQRPVLRLVLGLVLTLAAFGMMAPAAMAGEIAPTTPPQPLVGVFAGDNLGGVTDRAFVAAPPGTSFEISVIPGHFLDCGRGSIMRQTDAAGQALIALDCGVTQPETLILPDIGKPALLMVHF